jgi:recyclin-1
MDFFELVHVADLILQMVQMYYAEEMCKHIDKMDFLNEANKEKKAFERMIDDGVAAGLDKSIEVLIGQVEYILATMQLPTDYNPDENTDIELQATRVRRPQLYDFAFECSPTFSHGAMMVIFNFSFCVRLVERL